MNISAQVSWEIQDNVKLRSIISQATLNQTADVDDFVKQDCSDQRQPKRFVSLRPFQHPELASFGACTHGGSSCELRLGCIDTNKGGVSGENGDTGSPVLALHTASLAATAQAAEVHSFRDEYVETVTGVAMGSNNWCRFLYKLPEPSKEVRFKFLNLATPGCLKLANIRLTLQPVTQGEGTASVPATSKPLLTPPPPEETTAVAPNVTLEFAEQNRHQHQHRQQQQPQQHLSQEVRRYLDSRLDSLERQLNARLDRIEARLAELLAKCPTPDK